MRKIDFLVLNILMSNISKIVDLGGREKNLCLYLVVSYLLKKHKGIKVSAEALKSIVAYGSNFKDLAGSNVPGDAAALLSLSQIYEMTFIVVNTDTGKIRGAGTDFEWICDYKWLISEEAYPIYGYIGYQSGHFVAVEFQEGKEPYQLADIEDEWIFDFLLG